MKPRIKGVLCELLDIEDFVWADDLAPTDFERWDSLRNLHIITALEEEFGIQLPMSEILKMLTLGDIAEILSRNS